MDIGSHFLSGVVICMLTPTDPDPEIDLRNRVLIIAGAILPDLPTVSLIWLKLAKILKKKVRQLTLQDYDSHAGKASPWIQIYQVIHSFLFSALVVFIEMSFFGQIYLGWGLLVHQIYDLPTHKFKSADLNPKPLYPLSDWTWKWGIPCPWGFQDYFILSWMMHGLVMLLILASRN